MSDIEAMNMERYQKELEDDMRQILKKYNRNMGWNIPEVDEQNARKVILEAMQTALNKIGAE